MIEPLPREDAMTEPLPYEELSSHFPGRPARLSDLGTLSRSLFVTGGPEGLTVEARVIPVERRHETEDAQIYEIRLEVGGTRLGLRASPPGIEVVEVRERLDEERYRDLMDAHIPDHLGFDVEPRQLIQARNRIPRRLDPDLRYNTTSFGDEDRRVFRDTSYPWSAFGRCETNLGPFSGVMVGPRHLLTCNHGIDWTPPPGFAADWLTFTPSYYDGDAPFGATYATHVYSVKRDDNDGFSNGDEGQYDYTVLVLNDRIGDRTGWLGTRRYTDAWDTNPNWWHIGYPQDLTSVSRPTYQRGFTMNGDDEQDDAHQVLYHQADVFPGQSGGPMFGFWAGDVGPRAVAVQSWQDTDSNGASGGGDLVDLAIRARSDHP
ncbi:trypsin-like serine peptidase [Catellatospora tritici]|uniref:trypsin-like serine peptidase n=1 Tax=Catellatospora tritici TaxID=2851566 RepID=UPI001C2DB8A8|nr:hypothetical protein [Catellatospora tritici]MBV1856279.1 hypothetical protein [Catellatospora tritici]